MRIWVHLALHFYCRKKIVHFQNPREGIPTILACNHPNSVIDALIITTSYRQKIWMLVRGDVFRKRWVARILSSLNMIPIYRLSEGKEYLRLNGKTFEACLEVLKQKRNSSDF